ncbi:MAG: thioesterase family protein [Burkholderiaceae bacterium]|jgi:acyl-CoA thioester hydrolase|nr:acyl-CoA thioesterase [Burkholderiales bacterium]MCZ8100347.1 thioesterase family protein [Burkholderiales bacterium]MCZ8340998.1 thioesterase family protein [Burkholderiaceae bacterium]
MTERVPICELAIPIRWGDMDAMGHVNNTVYFRYMEQCRISWFGAMGILAGPDGHGPIIVNASCTFRRELVYPGTVLVRTFVGEFGRTSVETTYELVRTDDPATVYADGAAKVVWIDFPKRRSEPWPDSVRQAILTPRGTLV